MLENIPLAPYTTLKVGGPARWFVEASTEEELLEAVRFARARNLPLFVLGGGSNLLVADAGFHGVVVKLAMKGILYHRPEGENQALLAVGAAEPWENVVLRSVRENCSGLECLAGIPGTVGAAPVQNIGAYGQEVGLRVVTVRALDIETGEICGLDRAACEFGYRRSLFNSTAKGRYIITRVILFVDNDGPPTLTYPDLRRHFAGRDQPPSVREVYDAVREIRHRKGMLLVDGEEDCRSAGSFFKNPFMPLNLLDAVACIANVPVDDVPRYLAGDDYIKIPAAFLVEKAGFAKGFALGRAAISSRHTLALINRGGATAADIMALRDLITKTVHEKFAIWLEQEPVTLG